MKNPELTRRAVMGADPGEHDEKVAEAARFAKRMTGGRRSDDSAGKSDLDVSLRAARRVRDPNLPGV